MSTFSRSILAAVCIILTSLSQVNAAVYNVALSTTAGGTATAASSTPFAGGYEANWANDGVVTFCNDLTYCPGPYTGKLFKSQYAQS